MDALMNETAAASTSGIVTDKIILLEVTHPEVPVLDLVDLPGMVHMDIEEYPDKKESIEKIYDYQLEMDKKEGGSSCIYLIVHPSPSETNRPNINHFLNYVKRKGLLDRAIGVFTKADSSPPDQLRAFITGKELEDLDDDGSVRKAADIGAVPLTHGWITTMLKPPAASRDEIKYYSLHSLERLKKMENEEKCFFGDNRELNVGERKILRDLYDRGLAGTSALGTRLMEKYYEHVRTTWLTEYLSRLCKHELELRYERALLGTLDDQWALKTTRDCLFVEGIHCFEMFTHLVIRAELGPKLKEPLLKLVGHCDEKIKFEAVLLDEFLTSKGEDLKALVNAVVQTRLADLYTREVSLKLQAEVQVFAPEDLELVSLEEAGTTAGSTKSGYWKRQDGTFARALFGTDFTEGKVAEAMKLHLKVIAARPVQLAHFPEYSKAVTAEVRTLCEAAAVKISEITSEIIDEFVSPSSQYLRYTPLADCKYVGFSWRCGDNKWDPTSTMAPGDPTSKMKLGSPKPFMDTLNAAIIRYLPTPKQLQSAVEGLRLSEFSEKNSIVEQRKSLNEGIDRVETAMKQLVEVLNVDPDPAKSLAPVVEAIMKEYGLVDLRSPTTMPTALREEPQYPAYSLSPVVERMGIRENGPEDAPNALSPSAISDQDSDQYDEAINLV